ncbi:MAG: thioredoxin domain-containing protein [Candidatus Roizmanbacteria bacterium]
MSQNLSTSQRFKQGAGSVGTILAVLVAILIGYLTFKVSDLEKRIKVIESKPAAAAQPQAQDTQKPVEMDKIKALITKGNIMLGDQKSKLIIVEFSDPSCPFCHVAVGLNPEVSAAMSGTGDRFKTVANGGTYVAPVQEIRKLVDANKILYIPMYANGHGSGEIAAQALYCAQEKNAFWPTHELLFTKAGYDLINDTVKNDKANAPQLAQYLSSAVDTAFMSDCLSSGKYATKIAADQAKAQELGFGGTPMFLVNGERFNGAYSFTDMKASVDKYIQ